MNNSQYLIEYFNQLPILIKTVWGFTCALVLMNILLIIYLKYYRNYLRGIKKSTLEYQKIYEELLITYLYSGSDDGSISSEQQSIINQLKIDSSKKFKRRIAISTLLRLMKEITGDTAESISKLYVNSGFSKDALENLKSRNWHIVAKGIRELTLFQVTEVLNEVLLHKNHSKKEVRKEVQLYVVNLFNFKGLEYLSELKSQLSEWDQIQLLEVLQRFENQQLPDITQWLKSSNDSVVVFALKLAKIYNQFEVKDTLIELLSHKIEKIRVQTIAVLDHLYVSEVKGVLKKSFENRTKSEQIAIFKLLENLADGDDEYFVLDHLYHTNFEIRLCAFRTLKLISIDKFNSEKIVSSALAYGELIEFVEKN